MFNSEKSFKDFLLGLLLGGSIGAFLFKTEKGKKIQKKLLSKYQKISDKAHDFIKKEIVKRVPKLKKKR